MARLLKSPDKKIEKENSCRTDSQQVGISLTRISLKHRRHQKRRWQTLKRTGPMALNSTPLALVTGGRQSRQHQKSKNYDNSQNKNEHGHTRTNISIQQTTSPATTTPLPKLPPGKFPLLLVATVDQSTGHRTPEHNKPHRTTPYHTATHPTAAPKPLQQLTRRIWRGDQ